MDHDLLSFMNLYEIFGYIQSRAWNSLSSEDNKQIDALSARQIKAMMILYLRRARSQEALTLNQLAELLDMKKAAASLLVSDLVRKRLVSRDVDPRNRRFIRITLAVQGQRLGDAIAARAAIQAADLLECLSGEERAAFTSLADKIYDCFARKVAGAQ